MPLCKDCRHYREDSGACAASKYSPDPVTGEQRFYLARVERMFEVRESCGPAGRNFVQRELEPDADFCEAIMKDHEEIFHPVQAVRGMTIDEFLDDPRHTPYNYK